MSTDIKKDLRLASSEDLVARGHLDNLGFPRQANLPNNLDLEGFFEVGIWRTTAGLNLVGLPSGETGANGLFKQWGDVELLHGVYRNIQEYINLSTGAHYERTRHESTGTWTGWVSVDNRNQLTNTYNNFSELGIQSPQTIQSLIDSLPDNSIYNGFNSGSEVVSNAPFPNGKLLIMKYNEYRVIVKFWGQGQLDNEQIEYTGFSYQGAFKKWKPVPLIEETNVNGWLVTKNSYSDYYEAHRTIDAVTTGQVIDLPINLVSGETMETGRNEVMLTGWSGTPFDYTVSHGTISSFRINHTGGGGKKFQIRIKCKYK